MDTDTKNAKTKAAKKHHKMALHIYLRTQTSFELSIRLANGVGGLEGLCIPLSRLQHACPKRCLPKHWKEPHLRIQEPKT